MTPSLTIINPDSYCIKLLLEDKICITLVVNIGDMMVYEARIFTPRKFSLVYNNSLTLICDRIGTSIIENSG